MARSKCALQTLVIGSVVLFAGAALVTTACDDIEVPALDDAASPSADALDSRQRTDQNDQPPEVDASVDVDAKPFEDEASAEWADAGGCNDVVGTSSPLLPVVLVAQQLPPMTGGLVDPGLYTLTKMEFFTETSDAAPPKESRAQSWRINPEIDGGMRVDIAAKATSDPDGAVYRSRYSQRLTVDAGAYFVATIGPVCPKGGFVISLDYSAGGTGSGATLQISFGATYPLVYTYTKQ